MNFIEAINIEINEFLERDTISGSCEIMQNTLPCDDFSTMLPTVFYP